MSLHKKLIVLLLSVALLWPLIGLAQEGGGDTKTPEAGGEAPVLPAAAATPADKIVAHLKSMTAIVQDNLDNPAEVLKNFKAYVETNGADMKQAGEEFESALNKMKPDEAQLYQDKLQRKMEKPLQEFLTVMLEFSKRHPEKARELDELLQAATMKSK